MTTSCRRNENALKQRNLNFFSRAPLAPYQTSKSNTRAKQFICHYPAYWEGCNCFFGTSCLIRGFFEDNAHRKSASHSSLFRDFIFTLTSVKSTFTWICGWNWKKRKYRCHTRAPLRTFHTPQFKNQPLRGHFVIANQFHHKSANVQRISSRSPTLWSWNMAIKQHSGHENLRVW